MSDKFLNKYRTSSLRLQKWDYGWDGKYFITICTKHRTYFFGDIVQGRMILSETGRLASKLWIEIPQHFSFVKLDEFVIMPDHMHGIVIIDKKDKLNKQEPVETEMQEPVETSDSGVSTGSEYPEQIAAAMEKWKPGTLGVIINQYKRAVTINARKVNPEFAWQSRYYEHIIRTYQSFERIKRYINLNTVNWKKE
ncbi:transposase [Saccharicrinis sp. FJH54]|uniref:transposase n=1 Tax=Saccharicrinis sp. FJH54 TaxID=3344665 RepID=UPI0035D3E41B